MNWILPDQNTDLISWIAQNRNISDIDKFFNPSIDDLHDFKKIWGIESAAVEILKAIEQKKKIFIHGDFDVDGICATSVLWDYLYRVLEADVLPFIPSRFDEGYGLSDESIQSIINQGGQMIITVDCGVKDIDLVAKYKDTVDFVITDHHTVLREEDRSNDDNVLIVNGYAVSKHAKAVVHPKISPEYPNPEVCGTTVAWKLIQALNEKSSSKFETHQYLDLVSLATVCDIMPLIGENRVIVTLGLEKFRKSQNTGIRALSRAISLELENIDVYNLGFSIGSRLNAAGRLAHALDAVRLLTTNSKSQAEKIAKELDDLNIQRQNLTLKYLEEAESLIQEKSKNEKSFVVVGEEWPEGIVGLLAGKLTERYNRPVLVGSKKDKIVKGSARSIGDFNIANALKKLDDLLIAHGGHALAAGFTLPYSNLEEFEKRLNYLSSESLSDEMLVKSLKIDAIANPEDLTIQTARKLLQFSPFGFGNPKPILALLDAKIDGWQKLGSNGSHMKLRIITAPNSNNFIEAIAFNYSDYIDEKTLDAKALDFAFYLDINSWNGNEKIQLVIKAIKESRPTILSSDEE